MGKVTVYGDSSTKFLRRDVIKLHLCFISSKAGFSFQSWDCNSEDVLSRGQQTFLMCALRLAQRRHLMKKKQRIF